MDLLDSPLFVLLGLALMVGTAGIMLRFFGLLDTEKKAHKDSLPLDGLRGLLASSVLFHHAHIWFTFERTGEWVQPRIRLYAQLGPVAVVMFFFVSGYLFWDKALRRPERVSWQSLLPNRAYRILPAYWSATLLIIFSALVFTHFRLRVSPLKFTEECVGWLLSGFPHLDSPNINGIDQSPLSAGVFWTLRMEWMFYACLPLMLWFRKSWRLPLLFIAAVILHSFLSLIERSSFGSNHIGLLDLFRQFLRMLLVGFSIGMIAAYRPWNARFQMWLRTGWAALLGLACLYIALVFTDRLYTVQQALLLAPTFFMVIAGNSFGGLLSSGPLRALGQISYSVYIFHGVVLFDILAFWSHYFPNARTNQTSYVLLIWGVSIAVVCFCTLSYWFIERPFTVGSFAIKRQQKQDS